MYDRIVSNAGILNGKPCIAGTRISVEFVLELIASGASRRDVAAAYPQISEGDVEQAVRYASNFLQNEVVIAAEVKG